MNVIVGTAKLPFQIVSRVLGLVLGLVMFVVALAAFAIAGPFIAIWLSLRYGLRFPVTAVWLVTTPYVVSGPWRSLKEAARARLEGRAA